MSAVNESRRDSSTMDDEEDEGTQMRRARKRTGSGAGRDPNSVRAVAKRREFVRLADPDDGDGDATGDVDAGGADDDDDGFLIRSSLHVELEHEKEEQPREKGPANCWWLNRAQGSGSSSAHRPDGSGELQGTPYMTRRSKEVRVKAVLDDKVLRMIVQGSNIREGVKQMDDAGMFHPEGAHAHTRYQMLAFD